MFFIVRCIFWLSVVYLHLPGGERAGVDPGKFLDMAGAHIGAFAHARGDALARQGAATLAAQTAERVADTGADWCRAHGEACADAVLAAMLAKSTAATPAALDTLTPADKASHWRGSQPAPRKS